MKTRWSAISLVAISTAVLSWSVAQAHHGWSSYDEKAELQLKGTVVESRYGNPHATIRVKTADKTWLAWLAPIRRMESRGLNGDMVKVGATVTVIGYPSTAVKDEMRAERIVIGDEATELR